MLTNIDIEHQSYISIHGGALSNQIAEHHLRRETHSTDQTPQTMNLLNRLREIQSNYSLFISPSELA